MITNRPKYKELSCPQCGKHFIPTIKHQKLCGDQQCRKQYAKEASAKHWEKTKKKKNKEDVRVGRQSRIDSETIDVIKKNKFLLMPVMRG